MQHHLISSAPSLRPSHNSLLHLVPDPKICQKPPPQTALASSFSPIGLRRRYGLLPCGLLQSMPHLQFKPITIVGATLMNAPGDEDPQTERVSASLPGDEDRQRERVPAGKVLRIALSVATVVGAAVLLKAGSALASSQLVIPSISHSAVATKGGRELLVSAWMGLMAGCLHTLTGPDHLAALAPLSIGRTKLESVAVGALWGCGHDAGQVIFGILFLLLKDKLQIEIIRTWGARIVGMTLLAIGITGIKEAQEVAMLPCLAGDSSGLGPNVLPHMEPVNNTRRNAGFTTFATGIVHGLQPDALIMILPALALPSRFAGAAFLTMFLLGTVLSMSGYTAFIGSCSTALQKRIPRITEHLAWGSSLVAILVGIGILASELFGLSIF
ncbi:hypothetical protein GOP47_0027435 [Adiantum capillus-veneris]|nr:hypothetical protein GOP47_0027435 [Adiantum capillus-veneris]